MNRQVPLTALVPRCARIGTCLLAGLAALISTANDAHGQFHRKPEARPSSAAFPIPEAMLGVDLSAQTDGDVERKSVGCIQCHQGSHDPHYKATVKIGCTDCHGGNATTGVKEFAHVQPNFPDAWRSSGNPVRSYTLLNHESPEFTRFVNPGDLRVAHISCGTTGCHPNEVDTNRKSMMTHGAMLWEAALYNNGAFPLKRARYGESYSMNGVPQMIVANPMPSEEDMRLRGELPFLMPLPKFENSQPANILRVFERGGKGRTEVGIPNIFASPGKPEGKLSDRGLGTGNRTDPVYIGVAKTRLLDPTLNFLGTNDHAGDYRSSGCTACHVMYANDRSPVNSGEFARFGNGGNSFSIDPTIPKDEPGHPIEHRFITAPPSSQCITCHTHPGTTVMNSYLGFMWWDEETDGELMYPKEQKKLTAEQFVQAAYNNPDEASARGNWSNPQFLAQTYDMNPTLKHTQFADFHGHGWVYRGVYKKDRHGQLLDAAGDIIPEPGTQELLAAMVPPTEKERIEGKDDRHGTPLHLMDIHLEKGMHCVDCHFSISAHGNGKLYGEVRNAIEIECIDCHGTSGKRPTLRTSGNASPEGGLNLNALRTPSGKKRFEKKGNVLIQNSMVDPNLAWEVVQTVDTLDPTSRHYNEKSRLAKTVRFDETGQMAWGDMPRGPDGKIVEEACAHADSNMSCIACHSSWNPSCYGCHLPQKANMKMPELHNAGDISRNYVSYNFQTLRDDVFMLARDGDVTRNRINPARSSCAIHVTSYNANRESIYVQQQTVSAEGHSGIAFSTNVPHTVRGGPARDPKTGRSINPNTYLPGRNETKQCTDCHISKDNDNNAIMAQLLMQGTNYLNHIGRYCWVAAGEEGLHAVVVTERDEPQTVFGSSHHETAFPQNFKKFVEEEGRILKDEHEHPGIDIGDQLLSLGREKPRILSVQTRGEYAYAACGERGLKVFDIANIDNKGFSERMNTASLSPLGQRFFVKTAYATAVASPSTLAPDPTRTHRPENEETPVHAMYAYLYIADKYEGLITVGAGTIIDGNPLNNFLKREVTFNPNGVLNGANNITIFGTFAYITCDAGLVVVSLDDPTKPQVTSVIGGDFLRNPRAFQGQFRYGYVCDEDGIKVLDVTNPATPRPMGVLPLEDAHNIYLARTYAYVAAGRNGLVILDIEKPDAPRIDQVFNAGGCINDLHDVKLGITYVSEFAYLADGKNGMRIVQLTSPETPGNDGFSPRPTPQLIATFKIPKDGEALAISKGMDRDRAVDESGHQLSVFGRIGARPFDLEQQRKLYLRPGSPAPWWVSDDPQDPVYGNARPYIKGEPLR
ncbi:hypothetical protein P12x_001060 [Tundrisphaera lichenicola]|uniref:hypothetical protein n=1 Tax=Tundrisphaera lichenicola TaxID=2029860 RepID=UPI003EBC93BD